jgi:predicted ATPase
MRTSIAAGSGFEVRTEGDSFFAVFPTPSGAIRAAVAAQRDLAAHPWPEGATIRVRMGLHTGEGRRGGDDYIGIDVHRAARIAEAAHGGQILVSDSSRGLLEHDLPDGVRFRKLGTHRLKDMPHPEHLSDLLIDGVPSEFPPPRSLDARPNKLPVSLTSFVGRGDDIAACADLLTDHRLVTLTGPAGTGKTRLALEVAADVLPRFADGAFFVDLASVNEAGLVAPAMARVLGIKEQPARELEDTLGDCLADKELLLVADNFEHLLDATPIVERLLRAAPRLRVLATSRSPLGLYGEQERPVPPLRLPDAGSSPDVRALSRSDAVALFLERAKAVEPDFDPTDRDAEAIAGICGRLDGLPLAIELAASRIKVLSPQGILTRLKSSLDLLTASARNVPERQRTLRGAIRWSYDLLDEPDRRLFARCSVFAGGADMEAIEAVCLAGAEAGRDPVEAVASLVDMSLIRRIDTGRSEPRYGMLVTIRMYAGERLQAEFDAGATRRRHAEHFLRLAERMGAHVADADFTDWLARFDRDHDNLVEALARAVEQGETDGGMRAAASLWRFWQLRGHYAVGRTQLERLLQVPGGRTAARAQAHEAAANLAYWQTDLDQAERHYRESLAIYRELGDRRGMALVTYDLGFLPYVRGDGYDRSLRLFREALGLYEEAGDEEGIARTKGYIGFMLLMQREPRSALPMLEQFLAWARERGQFLQLIEQTIGVGAANAMLGNLEEARSTLLEALDIAAEGGVALGIAGVLYAMGTLDSRDGRHERAVRLAAAADMVGNSVGGGPPFFVIDLLGDPIEAARKAIGDEATERALEEGRAMSLEEAVAYVRESGTIA